MVHWLHFVDIDFMIYKLSEVLKSLLWQKKCGIGQGFCTCFNWKDCDCENDETISGVWLMCPDCPEEDDDTDDNDEQSIMEHDMTHGDFKEGGVVGGAELLSNEISLSISFS